VILFLFQKHSRDLSLAPYSPSLTLALAKQFKSPLLFAVLFKLCNDLVQFVSPQLVS